MQLSLEYCLLFFDLFVHQVGLFPYLEDALYKWFCKRRLGGWTVTVAVIRAQMIKLRDQFLEKFANCSDELKSRLHYDQLKNFKAEIGWYYGFRNRYGLRSGIAGGESAAVDLRVVLKGAAEIKAELEGLDPNDVYNMDEAALFFRLPPSRTLMAHPGEHGGKKSKVLFLVILVWSSLFSSILFFHITVQARLTFALIVNITGSDKGKPIVIGRYQNPRCFKNAIRTKMACQYFNTRKAWMNGEVFQKILADLNKRFKKEKRHCVLLIDGAG